MAASPRLTCPSRLTPACLLLRSTESTRLASSWELTSLGRRTTAFSRTTAISSSSTLQISGRKAAASTRKARFRELTGPRWYCLTAVTKNVMASSGATAPSPHSTCPVTTPCLGQWLLGSTTSVGGRLCGCEPRHSARLPTEQRRPQLYDARRARRGVNGRRRNQQPRHDCRSVPQRYRKFH